MELQLAKYRKLAGFKSRDAFAEHIGVNKYTYRSWESGAAMMNLEQAYDCAIALGCTLNDLVGMKSSRSFADPRQAAINGHFETFNDSGKTELATIAERMSHDPSIRIEKDRQKSISVQKALDA